MKKLIFIIYCITSVFLLNGQQPESFKASDGETLFFSSIGTGPKILLLTGGPGYAASSLMYWVDSLSSDFECILFDLRGAGHAANVTVDSTTVNIKRTIQDIDDLRRHLGEEKLTICGISFGGALAQSYAAHYPENTKNIVLVSTIGLDYNYDAPFTDNVIMRFYPSEKDSIEYWKKHSDKKLAHTNIMMLWLKPYFYDHDLASQVLPKFFAENTFYGKMSYIMTKDLQKNYDIKLKLKDYKGPCTIIRPRQDPIPAQAIYQIRDILPQTNIIFIEKCGHLPGLERPDIFYKILKEVL